MVFEYHFVILIYQTLAFVRDENQQILSNRQSVGDGTAMPLISIK